MSSNQANYGIERSRDYQKSVIQELIGVKNIKTVRESLELAGLSTAQRSYTGAELLDSGFVNIRKLFDQGWTKKRIVEEYLGLQSTSDDSTTTKDKRESDELAAIESALEEGALEVGEVLAETAAVYLVERLPQLLVQKLGQRVRSGDIRAAFARAREEAQTRQLGGAVETSRQQEMLENFTFPAHRRALRSAAPVEEENESDSSPDPWSEYELSSRQAEEIDD